METSEETGDFIFSAWRVLELETMYYYLPQGHQCELDLLESSLFSWIALPLTSLGRMIVSCHGGLKSRSLRFEALTPEPSLEVADPCCLLHLDRKNRPTARRSIYIHATEPTLNIKRVLLMTRPLTPWPPQGHGLGRPHQQRHWTTVNIRNNPTIEEAFTTDQTPLHHHTLTFTTFD